MIKDYIISQGPRMYTYHMTSYAYAMLYYNKQINNTMEENKNVFTQAIESGYGALVNQFNEWFEKVYKEKVEWDKMFGNDYKDQKDQVYFHELPPSIQMGIFHEFQNYKAAQYQVMYKEITSESISALIDIYFQLCDQYEKTV